MFNKGQLAGLMKQAQAMQDNLKKAQDEATKNGQAHRRFATGHEAAFLIA